MKNILIIGGLIICGLLVSGCSVQDSVNNRDNDLSVIQGEEAKMGDLTKTGTVVKTADRYYLVETNGNKVEVDSYKYTVAEYEGQTLTVVGQFSGDTLFIGEIQ